MDEIFPRHFHESAKAAGLPASALEKIFSGLGADSESAFERTCHAMPSGFSGSFSNPIAQGVRQKLQGIEDA